MSNSDQDMEVEDASNVLPELNWRFTPEEFDVLFTEYKKNKVCVPDRAEYIAGELNKKRSADEELSADEVMHFIRTMNTNDKDLDASGFLNGVGEWSEEREFKKFIESSIVSVENQIKLDKMYRDGKGEMKLSYATLKEMNIEKRTFKSWQKKRVEYDVYEPKPLEELVEKYEIRHNRNYHEVVYKRGFPYASQKGIEKRLLESDENITSEEAEAIGRSLNMSGIQVIRKFKKEKQKKRKLDNPGNIISKKKRSKKTKYEDDTDYKPPSETTVEPSSKRPEKRYVLDKDPAVTCHIHIGEPLDFSSFTATSNTPQDECSNRQLNDISDEVNSLDYDDHSFEKSNNSQTAISSLKSAEDSQINGELVEEVSVVQSGPKDATKYQPVDGRIVRKKIEDEGKALDSMDARSDEQRKSSKNVCAVDDETKAQRKTVPNKPEFVPLNVENVDFSKKLIRSSMETNQNAAKPPMNGNSPSILSDSTGTAIRKTIIANGSSSHSTLPRKDSKDAKEDSRVVASVDGIGALCVRDLHSLSGKEYLESGVIYYMINKYASEASNILAEKNVKLWCPQGDLFNLLVRDGSRDCELEYPLKKDDREIMKEKCKGYSNWTLANPIYFENRMTILPVNHGNHWMLAVIVNPLGAVKQQNKESDQDSCCILFFDSIGSYWKQINNVAKQNQVLSEREKFVREVLVTYLEEIFNVEYEQIDDVYFEKNQVNFKPVENVPQQENGYDCGLYVISFVREILSNIGNWLPHIQDNQNFDWKTIYQNRSSFSSSLIGLRHKIYKEALSVAIPDMREQTEAYNLQFEQNDASDHEQKSGVPPYAPNTMESFAGNDECDQEDQDSGHEDEYEEITEEDQVEADNSQFNTETTIVENQEAADEVMEKEDKSKGAIPKSVISVCRKNSAVQPTESSEDSDVVFIKYVHGKSSTNMVPRSGRQDSNASRGQYERQNVRSRFPLLLENHGMSCFINAAMNMIHAIPTMRKGLANAPEKSDLMKYVANILRGHHAYIPILRQLIMSKDVGNAQTFLIFILGELYKFDKRLDCWSSIQFSYGGYCLNCNKQIPAREELMVELGMYGMNGSLELQELFNSYISQLFIRCPDCMKRMRRSYRAPRDHLIVNINGQNRTLAINNFDPNAYFSFFCNAWEPVAFVGYQYNENPNGVNHYLSYLKLDNRRWQCINDDKVYGIEVFPKIQMETIVFKRITLPNRFY